jgi:carboxypeptidase C (cathepsin A)
MHFVNIYYIYIVVTIFLSVANIIFLDAPVGTGFSYANSWEGYSMTDTLSAAQTYTFLRKVMS